MCDFVALTQCCKLISFFSIFNCLEHLCQNVNVLLSSTAFIVFAARLGGPNEVLLDPLGRAVNVFYNYY